MTRILQLSGEAVHPPQCCFGGRATEDGCPQQTKILQPQTCCASVNVADEGGLAQIPKIRRQECCQRRRREIFVVLGPKCNSSLSTALSLSVFHVFEPARLGRPYRPREIHGHRQPGPALVGLAPAQAVILRAFGPERWHCVFESWWSKFCVHLWLKNSACFASFAG